MKWKLLILWALVMLIAGIAGCLSNITVFTAPKLGEYEYVRKDSYTGPAYRTIPIWIDKNFGAADQVAIDDAIQKWNYAMNGYIVLKVVDTNFDMEVDKITKQVSENGWLFMKIKSDNKMIPDQKEKGYWTIGFTEKLGGNHMYLVRDRLGNDDIFGVTLHEIGHLMGADHVGTRLMYPHYTRAGFQCIDYDTIKAVAKWQDLDASNLNYCIDKTPGGPAPLPKGDAGADLVNCPSGDPLISRKEN